LVFADFFLDALLNLSELLLHLLFVIGRDEQALALMLQLARVIIRFLL